MTTATAPCNAISPNTNFGMTARSPVVHATATCKERGRPSAITTPKIKPSPDWMDFWPGYELHLMMRGQLPATISNRRSECAGHGPPRHGGRAISRTGN